MNYLFLLSLSYASMATLAVPELKVETESSCMSEIVYDKSTGDTDKNIIENALQELKQLKIPNNFLVGGWPIGEVLMSKIQELLISSKKQIKIQSDMNIYFEYKNTGKFHVLHVNTEQLKNSRVGCTILESPFEKDGRIYYKIGSDINPPSVTLGHELIHAIHAMQDHKKYMDGLQIFDTEVWSQSTQQESKKELRPGLTEIDIWHKTEELLTVLGEPIETQQLSEFWLRIAAGRLPRYAYQTASSEDFYESTERINYIMGTLLGENWFALLNSLPNKNEINFEEENASRSLFHKKILTKGELIQDLSESNNTEKENPRQKRIRERIEQSIAKRNNMLQESKSRQNYISKSFD